MPLKHKIGNKLSIKLHIYIIYAMKQTCNLFIYFYFFGTRVKKPSLAHRFKYLQNLLKPRKLSSYFVVINISFFSFNN